MKKKTKQEVLQFIKALEVAQAPPPQAAPVSAAPIRGRATSMANIGAGLSSRFKSVLKS